MAELAPSDDRTGVGRAREERRTQILLEQSEKRYRTLIDTMPALLVRIAFDGTILACEGELAVPVFVPAHAIVGRRLCDVAPEPLAASFQKAITLAVQTGDVQIIEYALPTSSGIREREARIAADGDHVTAIVRDVTDQKRADAERRQHVARIEMLDAISQAFAGATLEYGAALDLAVRRTSELIGDLCILAELNPTEDALEPIAAYDRHGPVRDQIARLASLGPLPARDTPLELVLELGDTLLSNDASDEQVAKLVLPAQRELWLGLGIHAVLAVPMRALGRITGALLLFRHRSGRRYADDDMVFAQAIADRAAVAIHSARLYAENQRQAEALRAVNRDLEERIAERTAELARVNELLRQQATEDGLTGLANRRHFAAVLELEIRRARRHGDELALLLCDVDFFKHFNDAHGHLRGDDCLKQVADVLKTTFRRAGDLVARYGGEEFAVVLPGCGSEAALRLAERLRRAMQDVGVPHPRSPVAPSVTLSVGCVSTRVGATTTAQGLIQAADDALYRAKAEGRNRVNQGNLEPAPV